MGLATTSLSRTTCVGISLFWKCPHQLYSRWAINAKIMQQNGNQCDWEFAIIEISLSGLLLEGDAAREILVDESLVVGLESRDVWDLSALGVQIVFTEKKTILMMQESKDLGLLLIILFIQS